MRNYISGLGQRGRKPYPIQRHIPYRSYKGVPPPPPPVLSRANLRSQTDPRSSFCYANCILGLTYGFLNKHFQEIKLFICHCSSFITTVRFLETLQTDYSLACEKHPFLLARRRWEEKRMFSQAITTPLSWIKTEVLFLYMFHWLLFIFLFITCHSRILQWVEFKNFCSFAVCCSFSITRARNTAEYRLNEVYCVCFPFFVYGFIILAEKVSLSKIWEFSSILTTDS